MRFGFALLIVVAVCICFVPSWTVWDDGLWPLMVTIRSTSGSFIQAISLEVMDNPDTVRYALDNLIPPESNRYSASQPVYAGEPLTVKVPTSATTRGALLWRYTRFNQYHKLVIIVEYRDGKREGRVVDIPDLHKSRIVAIEIS